MIDKKFTKEAKAGLLRGKKVTQEQIEKCEEEARSIKQGIRSGDIESGDDFTMLAVNSHNHSSLKEKLKDIEAALTRIENGSYGICICGCGQEIDKERLRRGDYCVKRGAPCQEKWEKKHLRKYW